MIEKERALRETLSSLGTVIVAYSGGVDSAYLACVANETLGDRALRRHRRQSELPRAPSPDGRRRSRTRSASATRSSGPNELDRPEYRANPTNRCYFCKHELYTHLSRIAARAPRDRRRRQQRRRSRRLSAGPAGRARVRRAQPARRGRSPQGRDPRAVAPRGPADLGRAGVGVPVVAHSLSLRGDRREAADDRARRAGAARCSASASAACGTTTTWRGSRSARDELARALEPETRAAIVARAQERSATATSPSICRAIAWAA